MTRRCMTCRHFEIAEVKAFPQAHGICCRYAPRGPAIAGSGWSAFPPVGALSGCAEHDEIRQASPAAAQRGFDLDALIKRVTLKAAA